jgi:hypothetical protein
MVEDKERLEKQSPPLTNRVATQMRDLAGTVSPIKSLKMDLKQQLWGTQSALSQGPKSKPNVAIQN